VITIALIFFGISSYLYMNMPPLPLSLPLEGGGIKGGGD
jgi:hypothetical protein